MGDDVQRIDGTAPPEAIGIRVEVADAEVRSRPELRGWIHAWMLGVAEQGKRTLNPQHNRLRLVEAYLFAIALRQLFRGVEAAVKNADADGDARRSKALRAARDAFDKAVPHAVDIRDVLVHFDEYERGKGKLQEGRDHPPSLNVLTADDGTAVWLYVLDNYDLRLDVTNAIEAAHQLAESVLESLSD